MTARDVFVSRRTVHPDDVERAAWYFLCAVRAESVVAAREQMLAAGPDSRVPMREVYQMFLGRLTPALVLSATGADASAQFFARLYVTRRGDRAPDTQQIGCVRSVAAHLAVRRTGRLREQIFALHRPVRVVG